MSVNNFDFSEEWEEVQAVSWEWIMWNEKGEEVIGWVVELRDEEFTDKETGEVRTNRVCYMATNDNRYIRFITPTDLRNKLQIINERREKAQRDWSEILLKITYNGKVPTAKGYEVKTFSVKVKRQNMPEHINGNIPELPLNTNGIEGLDEIDF